MENAAPAFALQLGGCGREPPLSVTKPGAGDAGGNLLNHRREISQDVMETAEVLNCSVGSCLPWLLQVVRGSGGSSLLGQGDARKDFVAVTTNHVLERCARMGCSVT